MAEHRPQLTHAELVKAIEAIKATASPFADAVVDFHDKRLPAHVKSHARAMYNAIRVIHDHYETLRRYAERDVHAIMEHSAWKATVLSRELEATRYEQRCGLCHNPSHTYSRAGHWEKTTCIGWRSIADLKACNEWPEEFVR